MATQTAALHHLLNLTVPPLLDGTLTRLEGPGILAYRYKPQGDNSDLIQLDLDLPAVTPRRGRLPLPAGLLAVSTAVRDVNAGKHKAVDSGAWSVKVGSNGHRELVRVQLRVGARWQERFSVDGSAG